MDEMLAAHKAIYNGIADWYVGAFYDDWSDSSWVVEFLGRVPHRSWVVDAGCGPGQLAAFMRRGGHPVVSADLAVAMLLRGKELDPSLLPVVADIAALPVRDRSVGGVWIGYTLEHVPESSLRAVIDECKRVLIPGGALAITVKCGVGAHRFSSGLVRGEEGLLQLYRLEVVRQCLVEAGFEVLVTAQQPPLSPHEFAYDRGYVLAQLVEDLAA